MIRRMQLEECGSVDVARTHVSKKRCGYKDAVEECRSAE